MSQESSGDFLLSMNQIQLLVDKASKVIAGHRHKTMSFADCPECQLKALLEAIKKETQDAAGHVRSKGASLS